MSNAAAVDYLAEPSIHERLRMSRIRARLEQAEIAEAIGVSRPTVSSWENGKSEPKATQAARWAEVTGAPVEWLVRSRCLYVLTTEGAVQQSFAFERSLASV